MATKEGGFPSNSQSHLENISATVAKYLFTSETSVFFCVGSYLPPALQIPSLTLYFLGW